MVEDEIMEDISDWARKEAKKIIEPSEKNQRENNGEICVSTDMSADRSFTNG